MDSSIMAPISSLNSLRRNAIEKLENKILNSFKRNKELKLENIDNEKKKTKENKSIQVSLALNNLKDSINYLNLKNMDNVYIPFKYFIQKKDLVNTIW